MTGFLRGSMYESLQVIAQHASHGRKRWIDTMKDCLKEKDLDVKQAMRMVHDRSVWWGFVRRNAWSIAQGMYP